MEDCVRVVNIVDFHHTSKISILCRFPDMFNRLVAMTVCASPNWGSSLSWSHGSCIYNYLCKQWLSTV